jgi:hypothetical protein
MLEACLGDPFGTWMHMLEENVLVMLVHVETHLGDVTTHIFCTLLEAYA